MTHVSEVVQANKGNPAQDISFLIDNYHGQTAVCGLLGKWILDLKQQQQQQQQCNNADEIRTTCSSVIDKVIKERFAKDVADRIVDLSKSEAAFLEDMMDSPNWRKLLIDLNYSHKDSALLHHCLGEISKRGHHREIAINENGDKNDDRTAKIRQTT